MASCAVEATVDVAIWFLNRASTEDTYLQPHKLQRLLYLAQGFYADENYGRKLMPATFVTHDLGPIEPNVFRVFEEGRPAIGHNPPPAEVDGFLERIWRRFGGHSVDRLNVMILGQKAYSDAARGGPGEEIRFEALIAGFGDAGNDEPTVRTADGRQVKKWVPGRAVKRRSR